MVKKIGESTQTSNGVDLIWDGWLNSIKMVSGIQNELEEKSLQIYGYQRELLDSTRDTLRNMERQSKQMTQEWKERFTEFEQLQPISGWIETIEGLSDKAQISPWTSGYAMADFLSTSQEQFETIGKEVVKKQQQSRNEVLQKIVEVTDQMKQIRSVLVTTV
ncbi:hypothetical protein [Sporosarcina sp. JAI121]|uniref:hypothetical protein n=1 Tax=Sporosarcina sp. JAI121 TaxID=2723064 RepID=UPI0015CBA233|nr:hypothetical protein [Sporosarcina sp. JAI121]NYF24764.1 hypothetical protein [Sporosarcina sp. JAI121]